MKKVTLLYERETIILFNELEKMAEIYTHNERWQKHLEENLGLVPMCTNDGGGKTYSIDKKRIKPPRAFVKLTDQAREARAKRIMKARRQNESCDTQ